MLIISELKLLLVFLLDCVLVDLLFQDLIQLVLLGQMLFLFCLEFFFFDLKVFLAFSIQSVDFLREFACIVLKFILVILL